MTPCEELFALAEKLSAAHVLSEEVEAVASLDALEDAAELVAKSFSGSWQGYHARIYYEGFKPPPVGSHFSEWGLMDTYMNITKGDWSEYDIEHVLRHIRALAGNPDITEVHSLVKQAVEVFEFSRSELVSIIQNELDDRSDSFLERLKAKAEEIRVVSASQLAQAMAPQAGIRTLDSVAVGQPAQVPPHIAVIAEVKSIRHALSVCNMAADIAKKAASHLERKSRKRKAMDRIGTNVFIGHGRSHAWRDLKDFVQDRLRLPWDEFNRVPVAGLTNIARLSEMLDAAAIAFVVMTAEDEMADGATQARMNVIHEAGLFQGRLGFTKAIVLLEDGCQEFSNIQGLGQIRFPKGNISAVFEAIRQVLEREGVIE